MGTATRIKRRWLASRRVRAAWSSLGPTIALPTVEYRGPFVLNMREEAWFNLKWFNVNMMQKGVSQ
jgi:hypothetical protein